MRFPQFPQNVAQDVVVYSRDAVTLLPSNSVSCSIGVARSAAREFHALRCFFALFLNGELYDIRYDRARDYVTGRSIDTVDYASGQNSAMTALERR